MKKEEPFYAVVDSTGKKINEYYSLKEAKEAAKVWALRVNGDPVWVEKRECLYKVSFFSYHNNFLEEHFEEQSKRSFPMRMRTRRDNDDVEE